MQQRTAGVRLPNLDRAVETGGEQQASARSKQNRGDRIAVTTQLTALHARRGIPEQDRVIRAPLANVLPAGEKTSVITSALCPFKLDRTLFLATSHSFTV